MIKLSKKVEYGLISILHFAESNQDEIITTRELANYYFIPNEVLGKVLQAMAKFDLIESIKGSKGGYRLKKPFNKIVFGDVIEAVEGPIHLTPCTCKNYVCPQEPQCNIKEPIFHFQDQLLKFIFGMSLETFKNREEKKVVN